MQAPAMLPPPPPQQQPQQPQQHVSNSNASAAWLCCAADEGFSPRLVVYGLPGAKMPVGAPGDPAKDYVSNGRRGDGHCGMFQPGAAEPYTLCPTSPLEAPRDSVARDCCRHYAYCAPYARVALLPQDQQSAVVAARRLLRLPPERWQAILAHELGHAVDFFLFGSRYGLRSQQAAVRAAPQELRSLLEEANSESDVEVRADLLADALVLRSRGLRLCYDPVLTLQLQVGAATTCEGDGSSTQLMQHFKHPLITR